MIDATEILQEFARWVALQVIDLWDATDIVREFLETGDEDLRIAAAVYAYDVARAAATTAYAVSNAAYAAYAASNAAYAAAYTAAADAAADAAAYAAAFSAGGGARKSMRARQNDKLESMIGESK
jgi:hypothetical protein